MTDFYKFASENPWLTFFLFLIIGEVLIKIIAEFFKIFKQKQ
jgi:hypothetical protein